MTLAKHNNQESGDLGKVCRLNWLNKAIQLRFNNQYEDEMVGWHHQQDRESWCAAVYGVTKSGTQLSNRKTTTNKEGRVIKSWIFEGPECQLKSTDITMKVKHFLIRKISIYHWTKNAELAAVLS